MQKNNSKTAHHSVQLPIETTPAAIATPADALDLVTRVMLLSVIDMYALLQVGERLTPAQFNALATFGRFFMDFDERKQKDLERIKSMTPEEAQRALKAELSGANVMWSKIS